MTLHTVIKDSKIESKSLIPLNDCRVIVTVDKFFPKRSLQSNRFYWVIVNMVVEYLSEKTGYTKDQIHKGFRKMFLEQSYINVFNGELTTVTESTSNLNSQEFSNFVDSVLQFCSENYPEIIDALNKFFDGYETIQKDLNNRAKKTLANNQ
jgi:hypothetical protein